VFTVLRFLFVAAILRKYAALIKAIFGDVKEKTPVWYVFLAVITNNYSFTSKCVS